jgi:hypothetical protein
MLLRLRRVSSRVGSQLHLYTLPAAGRGYVLRADWLGALCWFLYWGLLIGQLLAAVRVI